MFCTITIPLFIGLAFLVRLMMETGVDGVASYTAGFTEEPMSAGCKISLAWSTSQVAYSVTVVSIVFVCIS